MKRLIGNALSTIYFVFPFSLVLLMLLISPLFVMIEWDLISSQEANTYLWAIGIMGFVGLFIFGSIIPPIRKMYVHLPWLYPFVKVMTVNMVILFTSCIILSIGYDIIEETRNKAYTTYTIIYFVIARLAMCLYFRWKPVHDAADLKEQQDVEFNELLQMRKRFISKPLTLFGIACLLMFVIMIYLSASSEVDDERLIAEAMKTNQSAKIREGWTLSMDDMNVGSRDFEVIHRSSNDQVNMWIWDFADQDGDYVQVFIDGELYMPPFLIKEKPRKIIVPADGEIEIKGYIDAGNDSITYGVSFDVDNISYFNSLEAGASNLFSLSKK